MVDAPRAANEVVSSSPALLDRFREWLSGSSFRPHLLLLLFGTIVWANTIHPGDVNYDTPWLVLENRLLSSGGLGAIPAILWKMDPGTRHALGAEYLPVRDLTVLFDFLLFGPRWAMHHLTNVVWYLAGCALFLSVATRLLGEGLRAWVAGLLFTLHPVHAESVAWLASRKDVVSLTFFCLGLLCWWLAREKRWSPWLPVLAFLLSYWAKNTAIVLPPLLVALSLIVRRESPFSRAWWAGWLPYLLTGGLLLVLSLRIGAMVGLYAAHRGGSVGPALLLECRVVLFYLSLIFWPTRLSAMYPEPELLPLLHPLSLGALLFNLALLGAIPLLARRRPVVSFGIAWFYITLLPVAQIVPIQNLITDRYLILPVGGVILALVGLLPSSRTPAGGRLVWLGLLLTLALGLLSVERSLIWRSSVSLWTDSVQKYPDFPGVRDTLAAALVEEGRGPEAEQMLKDGLERRPDDTLLLQSLGWVYQQEGRLGEAEASWRRCLSLDPNRRKAANNLSVMLIQQGRASEALPVARDLVLRHPLYPDAWNTLGAALLETGNLGEAMEVLERAMEMDPYNPQPACNLGSTCFLSRDYEGARRAWSRCLEIDAEDPTARQGLTELSRIRREAIEEGESSLP